MDTLFGKAVIVGNKPRKVRRELLKTMDKKERRAHLEATSVRTEGESRRVHRPHLDEVDGDNS